MSQLSATGGFLNFSPIRTEDSSGVSSGNKENNSSPPVLSLVQFSRAPFVLFGNVKLGSSKSSVLCIQNPVEDATIEVTVDKVPSKKGFSVAQTSFTIQPNDLVNLTITWTPIEEGGVRELITFIANGVVKHQAILLGRGDAPKKRKKSMWDSIKGKKSCDLSTHPRGRKTSLKVTGSRNLQVSRTPQYKLEKVRSPLASLNKKACTPAQRQKSQQDASGQFSFDTAQNNSPVVFLVPAGKIIDSTDVAAGCSAPVDTPECRDVTRLLNKTVSPVGTPERFKKYMPRIQSKHISPPLINAAVADLSHTALVSTEVLSVRDALAVIESDLTHVFGTSPPNACSSFEFSDSLESANGEKSSGSVKSVCDLKSLPEGLVMLEPAQSRLTFVVKPKFKTNKVDREPCEDVSPKAKKISFTTSTITKSKQVPVEVISPEVRKIKTSRRRLLEKTLELSGGVEQPEHSPGTRGTSVLPVINFGTNRLHGSQLTFSLETKQQDHGLSYVSLVGLDDIPEPVPVSLSSSQDFILSNHDTDHSSLDDAAPRETLHQTPSMGTPLSEQADVFPVHNQNQFGLVMVQGKKRKSDEFLGDGEKKLEDAAKNLFQVKRSRVSTVEPGRPAQQKKSTPASQRQLPSTSASLRSSSLSSMRPPRSVVLAKPSVVLAKPSVVLAKPSVVQAKPSVVQGKPSVPKPAQRGVRSSKSLGGSSANTAKIIAVAQSKLTFITPAQTAIPRHPMPFAAKNMFYDERWIEKQETGFTWWINYVLTPDDFKVHTEVTKVNALSLAMGAEEKFAVNKAPTKEEMSFSAYTARRRLNRLRRSACQLFTSDSMVKAIQRLELEVEAKRLRIRKDRHLWKDIGERQKVLNWLLSYNPLWLRIGLETIYGEVISLETNRDVMGLAMFILKRLLWNPDIAAEFRHAKVPNLYKDGHEEALSRFTLKKLLLLVCFLDKAKESRLIDHDPCLFCMDAEFKSTKDLLLVFSSDFLSGEGILPRHLGYMGFPVSHSQKPLDEFNFAVKNLAVDLKCGIRLVRVMELFIQDWSLSRKLRIPTISRLQKIHNVDIALQVLRSRGVDLKDEHGAVIDSRDIVDGHREKTLSLLWKIIFTFQVEVLLNEDQLKEEIGFLKRTWNTKQRLNSLKCNKCVLQKTTKPRHQFEHSSSKIMLLMDWVNAVCQFYQLKAENFTVSFSDGRALCYLIHHYHPRHLPAERVSLHTTQTVECSQKVRVELDCSSSDSDTSFETCPSNQNGSESPSIKFKELLENEKSNFRLVNMAVSELGGVPAMINPADMSNTIPNEKVVTCYLSFLCARLLDLRNETRAARVIQGAWRKHCLKINLVLYQERNVAAAKIQMLVRQFLQRRRTVRQDAAAIVIQAAWRGYSARHALNLRKKAQLWALQDAAATTIQAQWKRHVAVKNYRRLRLHIVSVQALWRMKLEVAAYKRIQKAASLIQKHVRAWILAREQLERYRSLKSAAVKIQRNYRRWKTERLHRENHAASVIQTAFKKWHSDVMARKAAAALTIQSCYRMHRCKKRYLNIRRSSLLIQSWYRGHVQRQRFETLTLQHQSAIVIQRAFRASIIRKQMTLASLRIQRWFRASVQRDAERQRFLKMRRAAVTIQSAYRQHMTRRLLLQRHQKATVIQSAFRSFFDRREYLSLRRSVIVVQQQFRAKLFGDKSRKQYLALRYSVLRIQAIYRGRSVRRRIQNEHECATLIQSYYRRHVCQSQFRSRKEAVLVIQTQYRAYLAGKDERIKFLQVKKAALTLQACFYGMRVRQELREKHRAATVLQNAVRVFFCRRRYLLLQSAAIVLQCRYRAILAGRSQHEQYNRLRRVTIKLQAAYRGSRVRANLMIKCQAATIIQARFRMHKVRQAYLATKVATIMIQRVYRANRLRDLQMQRYNLMKSAAVVIQAAYRSHQARIQVARMHKAATIVQKSFRAFRDRKRFCAIKTAALLCQRRYRAVILTQSNRRGYLLKRQAAISLQAYFRGMQVRKQLQTERRAALLIQSHLRKYLQMAYYKKLQLAVGTVQARYRANRKMIEEMQALRLKRNAVVVLQSAFRGMQSRRSIKEMQRAACVLQRSYRAHCLRKHYLYLRSSVLTIQIRYRAAVVAKEQMHHYQEMRSAVILLQAAYRGMRSRREINAQHQAATKIQAAFRKHREVVKFRAMRLSAVIIQRYIRACIKMQKDRDCFLKLKEATIVVQAAFRGHQTRQEIAKMQQAATVIQVTFRMHKEQVKFKAMRLSAIIIQRFYRSYQQRKQDQNSFLNLKKSSIVIQAYFRGMQVRKQSQTERRAAVLIQSHLRKYLQMAYYKKLQLAVGTVQARYRANRKMIEEMQALRLKRNAVVVLQSAFRGMQSRRSIKEMQRAACVLQRSYRAHCLRKHYLYLRSSVLTIQIRYRAAVVAKEQMHHYQEMRSAVILLQAAYRGMRSRREINAQHQAATKIQAAFRKHREVVKFRAMRFFAVIIQRYFRSYRQMKEDHNHFLALKDSVLVVQAAFRGHCVRQEIAKMQRAATVIQVTFRMHKELVKFQAMRLSAIIIQRRFRSYLQMKQDQDRFLNLRQAYFRGMQVRKQLQTERRAALLIQSHLRKYLQMAYYKKLQLAVGTVQARYRANRKMIEEMQALRLKRNAVVVLQSAFRGMQSRRSIKEMQRAACVLQRSYRAHCLRKHYLYLRSSVLTIQIRYRAAVVAKEQMHHYQEMRSAVILLQAAYRGMRSRREINAQHQAATKIQAAFRKHREVVKFRAMRLSAVIIQRYIRACIKMQKDRDCFLKLKEATIVVQAAFRGHQTRQEIAKMQQAATVIQVTFRMHKEQVKFKAMRLSAIIIQRFYRSYQQRKQDQNSFLNLKKSSIVIQAYFRGMQVRKQSQTERRAAVLIQSHLRKYLQMAYYKKLQLAVGTVQARYRANRKMIEEMQALRLKRNAVVVLQSAFRGMQSRRSIKEMQRAACVLQRSYRAHCLRKHYLYLRSSVLTIQIRYRAAVVAKEQMHHYQEMRSAVILLQAAYRGMRSRREINAQHQAATKIQAAFRKHREVVKFRAMRFFAVIIQRYFRSYRQMKEDHNHFLALKDSVLVVQAAFRGHCVRQEIAKMQRAATVIQVTFRMHKELVKFQAMRLSAIIIQRRFRSYLQMKQDQDRFLNLRNKAIVLQAAFRGHHVRQEVAKMHRAAAVIQANFLMHRQLFAYKRLRWAAIVFQQRFRAQRLRNYQLVRYQKMRNAVIKMQALYRGKRARELAKVTRAARKIQSFLRMRVRRQQFLKEKTAAVLIQSAFRTHQARAQFTKTQVSAIVIQRWYRSCKVAKRQKDNYLAIKLAVVKLQAALRGMLARRWARRKHAAIKIQSVVQMSIQRRRYLRLLSCTVKLQSHCRAWVVRRAFLKLRTAAVTLQKHYRGLQSQRVQRFWYLNTLSVVQKLQARVRGQIQLKKYQKLKRSAITIQSFYRGIVERRRFRHQLASVHIIQKHFRAHLLCQRERTKYLEIKKAAVCIQTVLRGHLARRRAKERLVAVATVHRCIQTRLLHNRFLAIQHSVRLIQYRWRETLKARKERQMFLCTKAAIVRIQSSWRGQAVRNYLREMREEVSVQRRIRFCAAVYHHLCAVKIQRAARAYMALQSAKRQITSVIYVQRWVQAQIQRRRYLDDKRRVIVAQWAVRRWLACRHNAARTIQRAAQTFLLRRRGQRMQRGIIQMQALWRGHQSRQIHDNHNVVALRLRLRKVSEEVREEDRLCNKTSWAIEYLLRYKDFSYILEALKNLETATRLSPECCKRLVTSGATLVIFTLIRSCNRSVPCMEVITYAVQVLLNLSKYDQTTEAVYAVENSVDTLLDLLQIYREKAGDKVAYKGGCIFTKTCLLLVILLQDKRRALEMRKLPKAVERLHSICRLTARKHKMEAERTVVKQKMNASINGSFVVPATPRKSKPMPKFSPDWVLRKNQLKEIADPLRAVQMVSDALML
ncbi:hypothetical protein DPEC_G00337880 [Dallia pectoralis]|uniref:Uncharacterized protein n=1 Tax=Dallia pectoralis TaxID=75939 RepID=A0ACC2F4I6_DALPE|nr:hypothetical protein DPEC_G00337880 [Dallia pectoralis]